MVLMVNSGPVITTPSEAAELAYLLHASPKAHFGNSPITVVSYGPDATLAQRREAFRGVYQAIVARLGTPTLYGGSAAGPHVRWLNRERLVLLAGDRQGAAVSVHDPWALEDEEFWRFEGQEVAWSPTWPHGFDSMPYIWLLDRTDSDDWPFVRWPGQYTAANWEHLTSAIELLLAAWAEQLPVQTPGDWATFTIQSARDWPRRLRVGFDPNLARLWAMVDDRDARQSADRSAQMRARGWQTCDDKAWWHADIADTEPGAASSIAQLVVAELRARGAVHPGELVASDIVVNDNGRLWLPALGMSMS